jgi:hypothetical protein
MATKAATTVLERHRLGGESRPRERSVPSQSNVNVKGGGKGGTVVLITGILFIGYLYFSRRLPNVLAAINTPAREFLDRPFLGTPGTMTPGTTMPGGLPPYTPGRGEITPRLIRVKARINLPPPYNREPLEIDFYGTVEACRAAIDRAVFDRTGSMTLGKLYANAFCR